MEPTSTGVDTGAGQGQVEPSGSQARSAAPTDAVAPAERTLTDIASAALLLVALLAWAPSLAHAFSTLRVALLLLAIGPGVILLVRLSARRDRAAIALVAFVAWAGISGALSDRPAFSLFSVLRDGTSWLMFVGFASIWAIGRSTSPAAKRPLMAALAIGLGANALVAIAQVTTQPVGALGLQDGRAAAFTPNSVVLGGLMVGAAALLGAWAGRSERWIWSLPVALVVGVVANLSGSRASTLVGVVLAGVAAYVAASGVDAPRAARLARSGLVVVALAAGVATSILAFDLEANAVARTEVAASSGIRPRLDMWGAGLSGLAERPLAGWGPGQFEQASTSHIPASFVRASGPDAVFTDAHNVAVEVVVTTGIIGLALAGWFVASVVLQARGPLAWFSAGLASSLLLTPTFTLTALVLALTLGAAMAPRRPPDRLVAPRASAAWAAVGVVLTIGMGWYGVQQVRADALTDVALDQRDYAAIVEAQGLVPPDPTLADLQQTLAFDLVYFDDTAANRSRLLEASRHNVEVDPYNASARSRLALSEAMYGEGSRRQRLDRADELFDEALALYPQSALAAYGKWAIAFERGDEDEAARWRERRCNLGACPEGDGLPDPGPPAS